MNLYKNVSLYIIILLLIGCGNKSNNNYLAGYMSPGDFRPQGIAHEKCYKFTNITPNLSPDPPLLKSCANLGFDTNGNPQNPCAAVHCNWYMSQSLTTINDNSLLTEGIAVNDRHLPLPTFDVKISRITGSKWGVGTNWHITMVVNGIIYSASTNDIQCTPFTSTDETVPFYDPDKIPNSGDELAASGIFLKLIYVEFLQDIYLYAIPPDPNVSQPDMSKPFIKLKKTDPDGDYIVAQDYGI